MNKYGLISCILTLVLIFASYIPLGIIFGVGNNPIFGLNSHIKIPIPLFNYNNNRIFTWGMITEEGPAHLWVFYNIPTFIFLGILPILACISVALGSVLKIERSKKLIMYNLNALIIVIIYCIIGISIFSEQLFGNQFLLDIILYTAAGFYILIADVIFAGIAYIKHSID